MPMSEATMIKVIEQANVALISSIDQNGYPNTKAMLLPRKRVGLKEFYFTTNTSSMRVKQYRENSKACIYFYSKRFYQGIMIIGKMEVVTDQESKNGIWREGDTLYYPLGVEDPDYCVLKFVGERIRTYHNFKKDDIVL